jgi:hypothetical protein
MTSKRTTRAKTNTVTATGGYLSHKPGRRKGKVHEVFDEEGPDVAWTRGRKLGLKESTLRSWFASWKRTGTMKGGTAKSKAKAPTKSQAKASAPEKAPEAASTDQASAAASTPQPTPVAA